MYRLIIILLISHGFSTASNAKEPSNQKSTYVMCAAADAILATKMEAGILKDAIRAEAQRHANLARNAGASDSDLSQVIKAIQVAYNNGEWSWEKISEIGQSCTKIK